MTKRERKKKQIIIYELHSKLKIAQHNSHTNGGGHMCSGRVASSCAIEHALLPKTPHRNIQYWSIFLLSLPLCHSGCVFYFYILMMVIRAYYITFISVLNIGIGVIVFNATFNNISAISWRSVLLVEETGVPGENQRNIASREQTVSHKVVSSTHRHEPDSNS